MGLGQRKFITLERKTDTCRNGYGSRLFLGSGSFARLLIRPSRVVGVWDLCLGGPLPLVELPFGRQRVLYPTRQSAMTAPHLFHSERWI